ncbi:type VI secretion system tube protein TssD [Tenacibaculum maritimum]|uniref:type VI secretion system tube protein TssD n=1 Tax=Tenacibaculum maritimum TaxID=107401 RepID=UPI0012E61C13|nr:type VI secretion system tube protein TssD [Tenacibaculum maritimum]CAA0151640.1 conserved hypothetical protein [Tenacibaculum maritimum]
MSIVAKLFIGREERELHYVDLDYERYTRKTGRPSSEVMGGFIQLCFVPKGDEDFYLNWAFSDRMEDKDVAFPNSLYTIKDGEIAFYEGDFNGRILFKYKFNDCTIISYRESFSNKWGMETEIVLSAGIQRYKTNHPFIKQWNEKKNAPLVKKGMKKRKEMPSIPKKQNKKRTPAITSIAWVDVQKQVIKETGYKTSVGLKINFENENGGKVKLRVKKKDGTDFDNQTKEILIEEGVQGDVLFINDIEIKEAWEKNVKKGKINKLVVTAEYNGKEKKSESLHILSESKVLVNFRVHEKYKGEFGFDWIRVGDTGKKGDTKYKDIIGKYNRGKRFVQSNAEYTKLQNKFERFSHPVKKGEDYTIPILTLLPDKKAVFSLNVEILNTMPKKVELKYDKTYFKLNKDEISYKKIGKKTLKDYLEVKCIKEFASDQYIEVEADGELSGKLKILANDKPHRYRADIAFVNVTTKLGRKPKTGKSSKGQSEFTKYFNQALANANYEVVDLDLSTDIQFNRKYSSKGALIDADENHFQDYLNDALKSRKKKDYTKYYKIYFIDEDGGGLYGMAYDIPAPKNSRSVIVLKAGLEDSTLAHETFHAMGLYHTFDNNSEFTFKEDKTNNIMDYSDMSFDKIPVVSTYHWQWGIIHNNIEKE